MRKISYSMFIPPCERWLWVCGCYCYRPLRRRTRWNRGPLLTMTVGADRALAVRALKAAMPTRGGLGCSCACCSSAIASAISPSPAGSGAMPLTSRRWPLLLTGLGARRRRRRELMGSGEAGHTPPLAMTARSTRSCSVVRPLAVGCRARVVFIFSPFLSPIIL